VTRQKRSTSSGTAATATWWSGAASPLAVALQLDLIDEWHLGLHPSVADEGTLLFDDVPKSYGLDLVSSTAASNGIIELPPAPLKSGGRAGTHAIRR
jgi:dihydrofolate reductase